MGNLVKFFTCSIKLSRNFRIQEKAAVSVVFVAVVFGVAKFYIGSPRPPQDRHTPAVIVMGNTPLSASARKRVHTKDKAGHEVSKFVKRSHESLSNRLRDLDAIENPSEKCAALQDFLHGIKAESAAGLLASMGLDQLDGDIAHLLFDRWAMSHPQAAMAWAQARHDPRMSLHFMRLAALRWTATNLLEAVGWVHSLADGSVRVEMISTVGHEVVRIDPIEALRLASELPEGDSKAEIMSRAAGEWAVSDLAGSVEWALRIEEGKLRQQILERIVIVVAAQDLQAAANLTLQHMAQGPEQDRALVSIVQQWAQVDPVVASSWVSQFPDDLLGRDAVEVMVNLWARRDPIASREWLSSLPFGRTRNAAVLAYSRVIELTDAELAKRWELSVTALD